MALFDLFTRGIVRIQGDDAKKLLNDTLTCRFDGLASGTGRWFALLSPQGKILVEGLVTFADAAYWFDLEAGIAADFIKRMKMYRLRAKAEIEQIVTHAIVWSPDGEAPARGPWISYRDERGDGLGVRYMIDWTDLGGQTPQGSEAFATVRVEAGLMELGPDFGSNEMFPHDIGMDLLDGVDFKKGCYVGQEVVSRMQHRGTARRRPVIVSGLPEGAAAGAPVLVGEREAGTIGAVADGRAVAILRLDRVPDADAATVGGIPVKLAIPRWGTYTFGESGTAE